MKLSDPYNTSEFRSRATSVAILFGIFLGILLARLWYLQIWRGELYREFSDRNRFKVERLSAPRGSLIDRNGQLIADSRPRFEATFTRGNAQNIETELETLKDVFKWKKEEFLKRKERLLKAHPYQPQLVAQDLTFDELALIQSQTLDLPSVDIEVNSVRDYLFKDAFFHVIGYTREISEADLKRFQDAFPERSYRQGDQRGISGIEALYESMLRGHDGRDFVVVDVKGRRVNRDSWALLPSANRIDPHAGEPLRLTLDMNLQLIAAKALEGKQGAVVALDPRNGEVLAYVSNPALDPNLFTRVISTDDFERWMNRSDKPYLDRVVSEHYPPASTLKLAMATAALETGVISARTSVFCPGHFRLGNRVWNCWDKKGHGNVNVVQAIERSCDVFFYSVGQLLGLDSMYAWTSRLGMGRRTFIGSELFEGKVDKILRFNSEAPGNIPNSDWVISKGNTTQEAETINAAIGQGGFTVTALQLARMVAALAGSGKIFQPQLVLSSEDPLGNKVKHFQSRVENEIHLKPEIKELILQGMNLVVNGANGTAKVSRIAGVEFGGKTGTAQVVRVDLQKKLGRAFDDHALFVSAAPLHDPKIAVSVIVENGGHGWSAALIAKQIVEAHLKQVAEVGDSHVGQ